MEDYGRRDDERMDNEVFSLPVRAGKRTYFFDVKAMREGDQYLTITESKRKVDRDGRYSYEKHKIFLYREDFDKFALGMNEAMKYIAEHAPAMPIYERKERDNYSDVSFDDLQ
jgi:hypothetical protein